MNRRTIPGGGVVSLFARHPNAANLLMILMVLFGIYAIGKLNTQFFPTVEREEIVVSVSWSGASSKDVEKNIIEIIEPQVRYIDGVDNMVSYAREGAGSIALEFVASANMDQAVADVDTAVKAITNLPEDADAPKVAKSPFYDRVARLAISGPVPESTLRIYAKKIRDDLIERGIDKVDLSGLRDEELQVEISERELHRLNISLDDISRAIAGNSRNTPSGQIKGDVEKQIRALADVDDPASLYNIEIKSFASGEKVFLGEVATIKQAYEEGAVRGFSQGNPAIQLTIQRPLSADTLKTANILDAYLVDIEGKLPPSLTLRKYEVRADSLIQRISLLFWNGIYGLVLVVATLFIFLNARIAFWVAVGIPVAMLATLGVMLMIGQTINMITLFALIMMLGIIVDDAIVVGEHTAMRFDEGEEAFQAAENGASRMLTPVMAAMITTAAAFAPMLLITGIIGQIMGVMPYVVIAVIIASLIECFLILPGHLAHALQGKTARSWSYWRQLCIAAMVGCFLIAVSNRTGVVANAAEEGAWLQNYLGGIKGESLGVFMLLLSFGSLLVGTLFEGVIWFVKTRFSKGKASGEESRFRKWFDKGFNAFRDGPFNKMVELSFRWRYVTVAIALASVMIFVVGPLKGEHVKFVFFPSPEAENISAQINFNAGIDEDKAISIISDVEASLKAAEKELTGGDETLIHAVYTTLGSSGRNRGDNLARVRVQLTSSEVRTIRTPDIVKAWRKHVPKRAGVRRVAIFASRSGPPGRDVDLEITGGDVSSLKQAASKVIPIVSSLSGISGVSDDLPYGKPELIMKLLPRGAALGFTTDEVSKQVRAAFEGLIPRRFARGDDEITIRVSRLKNEQGSDQLRNFELKSPQGEFVPLEEVVELTEEQGFLAIQREDGKTIVSVTGDLNTDILTVEKSVELLNASEIPQILGDMGLDYHFGGRDEERAKAFVDLKLGIYVALAIIYIVLAWVFGNYSRPLAIMLIIPFGIVGALIGHWVLGFKLTILSLIGLLGLSGILVNDSIILVSRLDERLDEGENLFEASTGASRDRLRAVLLTSLTTIGGLIPLMFEKSLQAQFLLPMAITIVFGLGLATLLVLFLVPAFIGIGADFNWMVRKVFQSRQTGDLTPAE